MPAPPQRRLTCSSIEHRQSSVRRFRQLGPLAPIVAFFIGCLVIFSASRLALTLAYLTRVRTVDGFAWLFPIGIRMDTSLLSIVLFVPALAILVLPERAGRWWHPLVAGYLASAGAFIVFM